MLSLPPLFTTAPELGAKGGVWRGRRWNVFCNVCVYKNVSGNVLPAKDKDQFHTIHVLRFISIHIYLTRNELCFQMYA